MMKKNKLHNWLLDVAGFVLLAIYMVAMTIILFSQAG
jgi:hypothetical protein